MQEPQLGLNGNALQLVVENGLAAVLSEIHQPETCLTTEAATAYHRVIACLHEERTVIPFRFGAFFDNISQVRQVLRTHRDRYERMLAMLDGCDEMGLRILLEGKCLDDDSSHPAESVATGETGMSEPSPGTTYLARRRSYYRRDLLLQDITQRTVDKHANHFKGLCAAVNYERAVQCRYEGEPSVMVSLYFLVPRVKNKRFLDAFHALYGQQRSRALLTGPWPPYNFVTSDRLEVPSPSEPSDAWAQSHDRTGQGASAFEPC
jgi:hypothetical protein